MLFIPSSHLGPYTFLAYYVSRAPPCAPSRLSERASHAVVTPILAQLRLAMILFSHPLVTF
jgi:hypothetical protein